MKKKYEEILESLSPSDRERFRELFSLRVLLAECIIKEDYNINDRLTNAIVLSERGKILFEKMVSESSSDDQKKEAKLVLFIEFYHFELFIDLHGSEIEVIEDVVDREVSSMKIIYPWIYGRTLYDKYFYDFEEQKRKLEVAETLTLLANTSQGVFHIGRYIVGPFGLIKTDIERALWPTRTLKLYHCSDPSCPAFHETSLSTSLVFEDTFMNLSEILPDDPHSEWSRAFEKILNSKTYYYDIERLKDICLTIIYTFSRKELGKVFLAILNRHKELRKSFPNIKKLKGAPESIVAALSKAELFQLLLLVEDSMIVEEVEKQIYAKNIQIPSTEVREVKFLGTSGFYQIKHQCNQLGFRSHSMRRLAIHRLNRLIYDVNQEDSARQILEWKLRHFDYETIKEKIEAYTQSTEPVKVVKETVFSGPLQVQKTFEKLYGYFDLPKDQEDEELLISKILWKLGFDINIYPDLLERFWEKFSEFKYLVKSIHTFNDVEKDRIRSVAVNFFVELEDILEKALSFVTWLLLSDHYLESKFTYDYISARSFMCDQLEGAVVGTNEPLRYDKHGKNTLFPLVEGFTALTNICDEIKSSSTEQYLRKDKELPELHLHAEYTTFPFVHKCLLLDLKSSEYLRLRAVISSISSSFSKGGVLSIRNRLQHKRDDFPTAVEILNACHVVQEAIDALEINSIYPNVYLFKNALSDEYNRRKYTFEDYKGRTIQLSPTSEFIGSRLVGISNPQIIIPYLHVGNSLEVVRIKYTEPSEYAEYWRDFPLKKGLHNESASTNNSDW